MNSYVMRTPAGSTVVIDGGMTGDASYLRGFLGCLGNRVSTWFISHPHADHFTALTAILQDLQGLEIGEICASLPEDDWIGEYETGGLEHQRNFRRAVAAAGKEIREHALGEVFSIDDVRFEVLGVKNPEITPNAINNSSVVMRVTDEHKSILFTGDLGVEGGRKLMASPYAERLPSLYVQMAHHGQAGVDLDFYRQVAARYCLWPTPLWLWENDRGGGRGSGPWKTLVVREWMEELQVERNYVSAFGLVRIG
jgi:beta-lactamase superfamily II metal-dependent hydrolase